MKICNRRSELPAGIADSLVNANVFFSEAFWNYTSDTSTEVKYIYNDVYMQVVVIHRIKALFRMAVMPTEPFCFLDEGIDFLTMQTFLNCVMEVLKKNLRVDWLSVTPASTLFQAYPTQSKRIKFGNYVLSLAGNDEDVFARITSKHRNMIRRGEKSGIEVKFGGVELLDDYLKVDRQTWERSGESVDHAAFYREYVDGFGGNSLLGIAYKDGVPQCGLLGIYNEVMFYYMFGASADHPEPGSTHYLQWRAMQYLRAKGVRAYNFVGCRLNVDAGSKYENIQRFKKGFGGELVECYLFKATLKPLKERAFRALLRIRSGKTTQDVIDQEFEKWLDIN